MALFSVDVEADGPAPGLYSMVSFGVVEVASDGPGRTFYGLVRPITDRFIVEALNVSGFSRQQHESFEAPEVVMPRLLTWLKEVAGDDRCIMVSDNPAFDWQFLNYYLWAYCNCNPFGHSARRIGDFYAGLQRNWRASPRDWRKLRKTKHTHNPVDDAKGNAEALVALMQQCKQGTR